VGWEGRGREGKGRESKAQAYRFLGIRGSVERDYHGRGSNEPI